MNTKLLCTALASGLTLSGCGALTETPEQVFQVGGVEIASRSAENQMAIFITPDDVEKMCLAPAPDAGMSVSEGLSVGQVGETGGQTSVALGGRTGMVLLARELMYRACEFSQNYDLSDKEAYDFYILHLKTLQEIAATLPKTAPDSNSDDDG